MTTPKQQSETFMNESQLLIHSIKKLMALQNIREAELSRKTGIPTTTLHKILSGQTTDPRISTLQSLANYFDVSIDTLYSETSGYVVTNSLVQSIPIIKWSDCLHAESFLKNLTATNWDEWMTVENMSNNTYALSSKKSMEARFPPKTIFVVEPTINAEDGDIVVVAYPEAEEATLRDFSMDGPSKLLLPISANSEVTKLNDNIKIIGVVTQTRLHYKKY